MPDPIEQPGRVHLAPGVWAPESAIRLQYSRSGGPGGQNVNKACAIPPPRASACSPAAA